MRSRYWWIAGLAVVLCLAMPGAAFAKKGSVQLNSIGGHYDVAKGANLKIAGRLQGKPNAADWSVHAPVVLQRKVRGTWTDMIVVRTDSRGKFTFRLTKPHAGDYRIQYPGCSHYFAGAKCFDIRGGTCSTGVGRTVKLAPVLSVQNLSVARWTVGLKAAQERMESVGTVGLLPLTFDVVTGQSPESMGGFNLNYRVFGSTPGGGFVPLYAFPSPLSFNGHTIISLGALMPGWWTTAFPVERYTAYQVEATWAGNRFTTPGTATATLSGPDN